MSNEVPHPQDGSMDRIVPVVFYLELPFWLATPSQQIDTQFRQVDFRLTLHNDLVGVYVTRSVERSGQNLLALMPQPHFVPWLERQSEDRAFHYRNWRTTIEVPLSLNANMVSALDEEGPLANRANQYLRAYAHDLFPLINRIVDSYRAASNDPFVNRVSEWDCPLWQMRKPNGGYHQLNLQQYLLEDWLPRVGNWGGTSSPNYKCSKIDLTHTLNSEERVLLDAWSSFYRRQYNQTIVNMVTAIEVILDNRLAKVFESIGYDAREIQVRIEEDGFYDKLRAYQLLTGERIPGPLIHPYSPEVNRVRLSSELDHVRRMRNKLVHEGKVPSVQRGSALKIIETMSWLARCISGNPNLDKTMRRGYALDQAYSQVIPFPTFPGPPEDMLDLDLHEDDSEAISRVTMRDSIVDAILAELLVLAFKESDFEYVVHASLAWMGFSVEDAPLDLLMEDQERERFMFNYSGRLWFVFIANVLDAELSNAIHHRLETLNDKYGAAYGLVVYRNSIKALPVVSEKLISLAIEDLLNRAYLACVFEIQSVNEARKIISADYGSVRSSVVSVLGSIYRVLDKKNLICIELMAGQKLELNQLIAVELPLGWRTLQVSSIQVQGRSLDIVHGPVRAGVGVDIPVKKQWLGNKVVTKSCPLLST